MGLFSISPRIARRSPFIGRRTQPAEADVFDLSQIMNKFNEVGGGHPDDFRKLYNISEGLELIDWQMNQNYNLYSKKLNAKFNSSSEEAPPEAVFYAQLYLAKEIVLLNRNPLASYNNAKLMIRINDLVKLKNEIFLSQTFYSLADQAKVRSWGISKFTNPKMLPYYLTSRDYMTGMADNVSFKFIIHAISRTHFSYASELLNDPIKTMSKWDAISMSVVSNHKMNSYGPIGFILGVPAQNIMLTGKKDLDFRNHIGVAEMQQHDNQGGDKNLKKNPRHYNSGMLLKEVRHYENYGLLTPKEVIDGTNMDERNEIIVTGREGINIYPGMPASKQLKLMGCYIICRDAMQTNDLHQNEEYCTPEMKRIVDKICLKFSVPLLYLPGDFNN